MSARMLDGFWLPMGIRESLLTGAAWTTVWLRDGVPVNEGAPDAVAVHWPTLGSAQWASLLAYLTQASTVPADQVAGRWQRALAAAGPTLAAGWPDFTATLAACTGYSAAMLAAIESIDPSLVAGLAMLVWDYDDRDLQRTLIGACGLMTAAAGDETIAALDTVRSSVHPAPRFLRHGLKASFAVVDSSALVDGLQPDEIAWLGALDSILWDQNGCLSPRVHFVTGDAGRYAGLLADALRELSVTCPRGSTPRRLAHRAFDVFSAVSGGGQVDVRSTYDDDFAVIVDRRAWGAGTVQRTVNLCRGRVVVVRPVADVREVVSVLRLLPAAHLQSMSVAMAADKVAAFADVVGVCGITSLRSLGRAAFPQLAYSWDGFLPVDMAAVRAPGHFTTIEFEDPLDDMRTTLDRWRSLRAP